MERTYKKTVQVTEHTVVFISRDEIQDILFSQLREIPPGKVTFEWDHGVNYIEGVSICFKNIETKETP